MRRRPSNKAHLVFKGCLGSSAAAAEWSQFNRQHKNLSSISLSHSYYSAVGGASSIKHFRFIFFFSLPPPREERRKITLKPNREAMIKSESKANNTEDRTERRKKKSVFWSGAQQRGRLTKSLFAHTVELIKLI